MVYLNDGILFSHKTKLQVHATTSKTLWVNLENMKLSERSQSQKTTYYMIHFIGNVRTGKSRETGRVGPG